MQFQKRSITEGKARILIPKEEKISKKLPVFYNPRMRFTRDLTILFVRQFPGLSICDAMAGSGVRAIRFALECRPKRIVANDINPIPLSGRTASSTAFHPSSTTKTATAIASATTQEKMMMPTLPKKL